MTHTASMPPERQMPEDLGVAHRGKKASRPASVRWAHHRQEAEPGFRRGVKTLHPDQVLLHHVAATLEGCAKLHWLLAVASLSGMLNANDDSGDMFTHLVGQRAIEGLTPAGFHPAANKRCAAVRDSCRTGAGMHRRRRGQREQQPEACCCLNAHSSGAQLRNM